MNEDIENISFTIKQEAYKLGFYLCGICKAEEFAFEKKYMNDWLKKDSHGLMHYLEKNFEKRTNPSLLLENAKSIIVVALNYNTINKQPEDSPKFSKYVYGNDYHTVIKSKLYNLCETIKKNNPDSENKICVDTVPILEKTAAQRAGLGWIGKHTCLINKKLGSFFFLGEIVTTLELKYDKPINDYCGTCNKCIESCPTGAIKSQYQLDARKCISYNTIENRGEIPESVFTNLNGWAFGCDICQNVCPWNKKTIENTEPEFDIKSEMLNFNREQWNLISEIEFKRIFKTSAVNRIKFNQWKRNIESL
ncbi:MAG: tRNA epoxyqueuosine(34) reductase QueG [Bacteroidetes bacterium GWA2_31_9]|nr:MAG: tRNA epoxyqueuosine(34) reductase QueG [Bacteroidetes bacterium GWA2_31_9]